MREDAPADRITPANEGERAIAVFMIQTYKEILPRFSISPESVEINQISVISGQVLLWFARISAAFVLFMWGSGEREPRRMAMSSATMEMAISSGVIAPISMPTGA